MEKHCHDHIEKQYSLGNIWASVMIRYMHARMIVCFFGRNMQTKWYIQSATLQNGLMTEIEKIIFLKKFYDIFQ
jgi:hypothetical protein